MPKLQTDSLFWFGSKNILRISTTKGVVHFLPKPRGEITNDWFEMDMEFTWNDSPGNMQCCSTHVVYWLIIQSTLADMKRRIYSDTGSWKGSVLMVQRESLKEVQMLRVYEVDCDLIPFILKQMDIACFGMERWHVDVMDTTVRW